LLLTVATTLLMVGLFFLHLPLLDLIELRTFDLRFLSRGAVAPSPAVVLAMVDEKSLDTEGRWPWPRAKLARLVDALSRDGAKVIVFDIGFPEPDRSSGVDLLDRVRDTAVALGVSNPRLETLLDESRRSADNDGALARALRASSAATVLGYFFHMTEADHHVDEAEIDRQLELIGPSKYPLVAYRTPAAADVPLLRAYVPEADLPSLTEAATSSGYFSVRQDADGVVRWMPLVIQAGDDLFPPLSVVAAWQYLDRPKLAVTVGPYGVEGVQLGDRAIPTDEMGRLLIDYFGPPKTFPYVSIGDVLAGTVPAGTFRGRIVLVGTAATGIFDARSTPFSPVHPGSEIHATVIDDILSRRFLAKPASSDLYDVLAIVVGAAVIGLVVPRVSGVAALGVATVLCGLHVAVARALFVRFGLWVNIVYPLLAIVASYTTLTAYNYVIEQRERKRIRSAFSQYVAPAVVEEMLKDPSRLRLGGEERVLTVLFSDLQGFTSHSERYTPHQMFQLLSEYYGRMTERIFAHEGMLKEYVGDELMAIFGAPVPQADHAVRACAAALEMLQHRKAMTKEWLAMGRPPLIARTGVNSGTMLVGNTGSEYRLSYGVLGDNVNLASRLEGLNKEYGTQILIGENTAALVRDAFVLREVDRVRVVGKTIPTRVYELVAASGTPLPDELVETLRRYASALEAYRTLEWAEALRRFEEILRLSPGDRPSLAMARRCRMYIETPPQADWDGVYELTKK